jgi:uncharacterized protein involved in exopolysaccharide biosynthesis/Mrp family chromosome partitioning ATPase
VFNLHGRTGLWFWRDQKMTLMLENELESSVVSRYRPAQPDPSTVTIRNGHMPSWRLPQDDQVASAPLWQLMTTLWHAKRFILTSALIGGLLTGLLALSRPVLYEGKAQLITSAPAMSVGPGLATVSQESINEAIDSHLTRLVSQAQLRRAINLLEDHSEKATLAALRAKGSRGGIVSGIGDMIGNVTETLRHFVQPGSATLEGAPPIDKDAELLTALRSGLRVGQELRSRVISVGFTDTNRVTSSIVANAVAQAYVGQLTLQSRASFQGDLTALNERIPAVQRELAQAIEKKEKYLIEMGGPELKDLAALNDEVSQLKQLLTLTSDKLVAAQEAQQSAYEAPAAQSSTLTPQQLAALPADIQFFETQVATLERRIQQLETKAIDGAKRISGLQALELEIEAASGQYKDVLSKRETLRQRVEAPNPGVSILSSAWVPVDPKTISPVFLVPPGVILFGLLASIVAVLRSGFDKTLRSDAQCEEALGIPSAGIVPKLNDPTAQTIHQAITGQLNLPYRQALSSIFVSLAPHHANAKFSKLILVTSSTQGESKTGLAWSLALCATRFRHRVLLLDLDTAEHDLTRSFKFEFGVIGATNNFADFADGSLTLPEAVNKLRDISIDLLSVPPNSADLLARLSFSGIQHIVDKLRQEYSFVIVNGPSIGDVPELRLLAAQADTVLLAAGWGKTDRNLARDSLRAFCRDGVDASIISSVLMDAPMAPRPRQSSSAVMYQQGLKA